MFASMSATSPEDVAAIHHVNASSSNMKQRAKTMKSEKPVLKITSSGKYNIKDFSPDFRFTTLVDLAETLAQQCVGLEQPSPIVAKKINYMLGLCPPPTEIKKPEKKPQTQPVSTELDLSSEDLTEYTEYTNINSREIYILSEEHQEAALAIGHFLTVSKGCYQDKILPILTSLLSNLPKFKWHGISKITPDFFAYNLLSLLREITKALPSTNEAICSALVENCLSRFHTIMDQHKEKFVNYSKNSARLIFGIFKALSEGLPPLKESYIEKIIVTLDLCFSLTSSKSEQKATAPTIVPGSKVQQGFISRLLRTMMILIIKIYSNIAILPALNKEHVKKFFKIGLRNVSQEVFNRIANSNNKTGSNNSKVFLNSIDLIVNCAVKDKELAEDALEALSQVLQLASDIDKANVFAPKLFAAVVAGMEKLGELDNHVATVTNHLRNFADLYSYRNEGNTRQQFEKAYLDPICRIVKLDYERHGVSNTSSLILSIAGSIYSETDVSKNNVRLSLLSRLANTIPDPTVIEHVHPVFMSQFFKRKGENSIDRHIVDSLVSIAHLSESTFKEITAMVFGIYENPIKTGDTSSGQLLTDALYKLNDNIVNEDMKLSLLVQTIELFNKVSHEIAVTMRKQSREKLSGFIKYVGIILQVIEKQIKHVNIDPRDKENKYTDLFRRMWFFCILFGFVESETMQKESATEYFEACQTIAQKSPILCGKSPKEFKLDTEVQINELQQSNFVELFELHGLLSTLIPSSTATIKKLNFARVVYLLTVYYVETLRASNGRLDYFLAYLEDSSLFLVEYQDLTNCLRLVLDQVFRKWLVFITNTDASLHSKIVEQQIIILLKLYCSRIEAVRQAAYKYISQISKRFAYVFWNTNCLQTLLDLLHAVYESFDTGKTTEIVKLTISSSGEEYILPENFSDREFILQNYLKLSTEWLRSALSFAPNNVQNSVQEYLLKFQQTFDVCVDHLGYHLATYMSTPPEYIKVAANVLSTQPTTLVIKDGRQNLSILNENRFTSLTQSVALKSYNMGVTDSLREIAHLPHKQIETYIVSKLSECLSEHRTAGLDMKKFNNLLQLASSMIINTAELVPVQLMNWVVWAPIYLFTKQSMSSGIYCWKWICSSRPDLEFTLLTELYHGWVWTISQKQGLFAGSKVPIKPVELAVTVEDDASSRDDLIPHRLWINFLAERYQVVRPNGIEYVEILAKYILKALEDPNMLSKDPNSIGTRSRVCLLALIVAKDVADQSLGSLIRSRAYSAMLQWFTLIPSWYDPHSKFMVNEDLLVMRELIKKLRTEKNMIKKTRETAEGRVAAATNIEDLEYQESSRMRSFSETASVMTMRNPSDRASFVGNQTNAFPPEAGKQIALISVLLAHEIERIVLWHNPSGVASFDSSTSAAAVSQEITEESTINVSRRSFNRTQWQAYIKTGWSYNPRLAYILAIRFPIELIREELRRMTLVNAATVTHIPEAVVYLVTPENVAKNAPELKHLISWEPSTLVNALTFLNAPYVNHPLVEQYAVRILRSFSPAAVVFYLPQLVQCLRHDERGTLKRQLLALCATSSMFAHQLLWTLGTEIINRAEMTAEEYAEITPAGHQIAKICEKLRGEVLGVFSEKQKQLYEEEFGFFEKINKISGDLIPEGKEVRQAKLIEMLGAINPTKNLYMPIDFKSQIVGMIKEKSTTLKSAKKVPILIQFEVKERKIDKETEETIDEPESEKARAPIIRKPLIFKAGDDCRQDQLALQIISMYQRIFKRARLPLYLYPYRVITTARGEGIIECVPDSSSRHQIGSKFDGSLYDYFIMKYGHVESVSFQKARQAFIESMAGYSIVSYILNVKDRHNGNILVDGIGHVIHIDFGFIFDIAPGGNFGIEQFAPFKLTKEMLMIMGEDVPTGSSQKTKTQHAEAFLLFQDLVIRGFLAARDFIQDIIAIVEVMVQSELPCFKPASIANLKTRLAADKTEQEAVAWIRQQLDNSYKNLFTVIYDKYQKIFEGVEGG